jgi:hypothetical protein
MDAAERRLRARLASDMSWGRTGDRAARTAPARAAALERFERQAEDLAGHPLEPADRVLRAESLRKAYFARLAYASAKARRLKREAKDNGNGVVSP